MCGVEGLEWLTAAVGALLIGISKTGIPGAAIIAIPLFASIMPPKASTGVVLPMLILADVFAIARYWRAARWRHIVRLFPWTVCGVVAGCLLMDRLSDSHFRPVIGGVVVCMLAVHAWRERRPDAQDRLPKSVAFAAPLGVLAGASTMMANAAGPVMTVYLLAMRLPKTAFVSTSAAYFFAINLFKVPFSARMGLINGESLTLGLTLAPAIVAGALLGFVLLNRIPEKPFAIAVQWLAAAGALQLML